MRTDPAQVAALMAERGLCSGQVAARMRRSGLPATTARWVELVRAGTWTYVTPQWADALAGALGVTADDILGRARLRLVVHGDLHRCDDR